MTEFRFSPRPNRASEIAWRPWGKEAFSEAGLTQKPVLLAISAVWCHWCHVMDETSYSDPGVIRLINDRYVPVRVDNDQRPDVNRRYNMGGWPTTAFLTPDGEVITGGTYIPPDVLGQYLVQVADVYRDRRGDIERKVGEVRLEQARQRAAAPGPLQWSMVEDVVGHARGLYDAMHGGFGREPKFPQPHVVRLLLDDYRRFRHEDVAVMLHKTLAAMAGGGLYDHVEGGFFRYATQRDWQVPHYEKMLEDNSELLALYAEAYRTFPQGGYDRVAQGVLRWMNAVLWQPERHLFGGSQDADEHYFQLDADARKRLAAPFVDPQLYADWNALAASGLAALGDDAALARAAEVLGAIRSQLWDDESGTYHFDAGDGPQLPSLLADLASLLAAELDLYEAGGGRGSLEWARKIAERLLALRDEQSGAFFDAPEREEPGRVSTRERPIEDNARAADALLRLAALTHEERWREAALSALRAFAHEYAQWGQFAAFYARAVARALTEPLRVAIVGPEREARSLWDVARANDDPAQVRSRLDPERDRDQLEVEGYPPGEVAAYVCVGETCSAPIRVPDALRPELARARERLVSATR